MVIEIVVSLRELWWALPLFDEVGDWGPSSFCMLGREFLVVDEAQLDGYIKYWQIVRCYGTQASNDNANGVNKNTVNEASVSSVIFTCQIAKVTKRLKTFC